MAARQRVSASSGIDAPGRRRARFVLGSLMGPRSVPGEFREDLSGVPKRSQDSSKGAPEGPRRPKDWPRSVRFERPSKRARPNRARTAPEGSKRAPKVPRGSPWGPKTVPRGPRDSSRKAFGGPKKAPSLAWGCSF
eukprot:9224068-Pyramimonas_sp.AAC.1